MPPVPRALTALGPAYIKFGQILSTRPDVVGDRLALELQVLQDKLPPFPPPSPERVVEHEMERPLETLFSEFSDPVAAASIAQVHKARLAGTDPRRGGQGPAPGRGAGVPQGHRRLLPDRLGDRDAVARLPPAAAARRDRAFRRRGDAGARPAGSKAPPPGSSARTPKAMPGFVVPPVEWFLSSRRVMTLGWAEGIPLSDLGAIDAAGHDRKALATRVLQMFLRHALRDGFFHADMHQGNLKVAANGDIVALDFGIMGRIDEYTRRVYAEILYGFIRKDYRRVAEVHFEAGYVPADRDVGEFAQALRSVGEPIFGMDASRISMARLLAYLFEVTERFGMETRTELILLQRTMVVVEGVARSLDPEMNIWTVARPVVEEYIRENVGPKALVRDLATDRAGSGAVRSRACRNWPRRRLLAQANPPRREPRSPWPERAAYAAGGAALLAAAPVAHRDLGRRLAQPADRIGGHLDAALHGQHNLSIPQARLLDRGADLRDASPRGPRRPSSRPRAYRFPAAASAPQVGPGPFERRIRKRDRQALHHRSGGIGHDQFEAIRAGAMGSSAPSRARR
jgi:ubiquinone biosynthesis protein